MKLAYCLGFRDWHLVHLQHCLASLRAHTNDPIILCDLGSHDQRRIQKVAAQYRATYVLDVQPDWSRSRALNSAAFTAPPETTDYVFTDADMVFPASWFRQVKKAVTPKLPNLWLTRSRDLDEPSTKKLDLNAHGSAQDTWIFQNSVPHGNDMGQGAAMIVPRPWFDKVGGFDEYYRVWGCEDNDLTLRASWTGLPVDWLPEKDSTDPAWVAHQWHRRDWPTPDQFKQVKKNREYLHQRIFERGPIVRNVKERTEISVVTGPSMSPIELWNSRRRQTPSS